MIVEVENEVDCTFTCHPLGMFVCNLSASFVYCEVMHILYPIYKYKVFIVLIEIQKQIERVKCVQVQDFEHT